MPGNGLEKDVNSAGRLRVVFFLSKIHHLGKSSGASGDRKYEYVIRTDRHHVLPGSRFFIDTEEKSSS